MSFKFQRYMAFFVQVPMSSLYAKLRLWLRDRSDTIIGEPIPVQVSTDDANNRRRG